MDRPCSCCGDHKPLGQFVADRRKPTGYASRCKACHAAIMRGLRARQRRRYVVFALFGCVTPEKYGRVGL